MKPLFVFPQGLVRLALVAALAAPAAASAQTAPAAKPNPKPAAKASPAAVPPLLDRELFFGNPEIAGAEISPDGQYIAFLKPWKETRNVWVKKTADSYAAARLVTADAKRPIPGFFWSRDSKMLLFVQDKDGDENYNVYAVDPSAPNAPDKETPPARNLTDAKSVRAAIYAVPKKDPDILYVGLNDRDASWHDLYKVRISTGERTLLRKNTERIAQWVFDLEGKLRLAGRVKEDGTQETLLVEGETFKTVYSCSVFETCDPVRFHKDGRRVYMQTNKGETDLVRLTLFDAATGKEEAVESDPLKRVDFGSASFSEATDELVATSYEDDKVRRYFHDKAIEADYRTLEKKLPGMDVDVSSATADDQLWLISAGSDTDPGARYLFDRKTKALKLEYKSRERIPREHMAAMKAIRYPSSDGLEIPAYLTLPNGVAPRALPLVVVPHGGPWARDSWRYNNLTQFLANRGYAVLQPNFRGSTGYGKKHLNAGNLQWGDRMQDDLTWGVKYLVSQGTVDPKRVGIMGGSYGGYATLAGVAFTPDLYAAAVSIVGPSNLITLLESIPPYWEAGRIIFHERMGNPTTAEGRKQLERQSPLNAAVKIKTPLMVAQGANDPRVKKAESDQIVIALRDRGFPVEYLVAPDEGHGFARPVNNMALFANAEAFLAKYLAGRFQKEKTPEVDKRLTEITVDPKTVVLTKKVDAAGALPKPVAPLALGKTVNKGTITAGPQSFPLELTTTISEEGGKVLATDVMKLPAPMGEASDSVVMDKATLLLEKRTIHQGPVSIEMMVKDGKATGTMAMGGEPKPFTIDAGGPVFADGAAALDVLATLPLVEGYTLVFRNLDVQKQKLDLKQLKVLGSETVTVAVGTVNAWKAEITSAEGNPGALTFWVAKDSRKVVKLHAVLPEMGGAIVDSELQP